MSPTITIKKKARNAGYEGTQTIRRAKLEDVFDLCRFTDYWLSGRGKRENAPGAVNDCFVSPSQHEKYIKKYTTWLVTVRTVIVGWAVIQKNGSLTHFLIAGTHRGRGIGSKFLEFLGPETIRSKSNQSSGDPGPFYKKRGYKKISRIKSKSRLDIDTIRPNRKPIIDIFKKT